MRPRTLCPSKGSKPCRKPVRIEGLPVAEYLMLIDKTLDPARYLGLVGLLPELYQHRMVDRSLSGGERKRIELASVQAVRPIRRQKCGRNRKTGSGQRGFEKIGREGRRSSGLGTGPGRTA